MKLGERESKKRLRHAILDVRGAIVLSEKSMHNALNKIRELEKLREREITFPYNQVSLNEVPQIESWLDSLMKSSIVSAYLEITEEMQNVRLQINSISDVQVGDANSIESSIKRIRDLLGNLVSKNGQIMTESAHSLDTFQKYLWSLEAYWDSRKSVTYTVINIVVSVALALLILLATLAGTIFYDTYKVEVDSYVRHLFDKPQIQKAQPYQNPAPLNN